jgi:hypothetical protein
MNRYPGIRAFEQAEEHLFFGRKRDGERLFALVKAKPLVVLFSKSGLGKSSLINAGLVPLLEEASLQPVKIRVQDISISPVDMVKKALEPFFKYPDRLQRFSGQTPGECRLWEYLKACEFRWAGAAQLPVMIFDQFEEFFEHSPEARKALVEELADMVSERLPQRIQEQLRQIPIAERTPEVLAWYSPIPVKVILAIRSDRLSLMDDLSGDIPSILQNRFQLHPLSRREASEAIVEPARLEGPEFNTPPFNYKPGTLDKILNYLSNEKGEIESFQLQLVCQHVEKQIKTQHE